jgi:hypothetical protein
VPALDGSDDAVWVAVQVKGFGMALISATPRLRAPAAELGEEALDGIELGGGRGEVEDEAPMAVEPGPHPAFSGAGSWDACGGHSCPWVLEMASRQ